MADETRSACELLSQSEINRIAGEEVQVIPTNGMGADAQRSSCRVSGARIALLISFIQAESHSAAAAGFVNELRSAPGNAQLDESLRGVGVEARYRPSTTGRGGTIVARFGTVVLVLNGNLDRTDLVQLARAAAAHL